MSVNLVIVESPTKAKTIQKYLGDNFEVISSFGHIVDLPKKNMGIDINNNFTPQYEIVHDKKNIVKKLNEKVKKSDIIWLAPDEDREGEAIAWHLFKMLNLAKETTKRITFHEITKNSIKKAIASPRFINHNLVNAQQARRILDRIVGFELSPILWKKIKIGLSAGRVQSVALKLIIEREKEITNFIKKSIYRIIGLFTNNKNIKFSAKYTIEPQNKEETLKILEKFKHASFKIVYIDKKNNQRSPSAPFTTSTLQQEASLKLSMSIVKTMKIAQKLYEKGFITYMRTDSVNLSQEALIETQKIIQNKFGDQYYHFRKYQNKTKNVQEAHEAIRPTKLSVHEISEDFDQNRLYNLIWKRTIRSQMSNAKFEKINIHIITETLKEKFIASENILIFDGFLKLEHNNEKENKKNIKKTEFISTKIKIGDKLDNLSIQATEFFLNPLPRYTEATLVKKLEELGIGRPSTYAPIISTIQQRKYIMKCNEQEKQLKYQEIILKNNIVNELTLNKQSKSSQKKLIPNDIGIIVSDFLIKHFNKILEYNFTAKLEEQFDEIASGNKKWTDILKKFYQEFHDNVEYVNQNTKKIKIDKILGQDPKTKENVYVKIGKYGTFIQIGESDNVNKKPKFASLLKNQNILSITLEQALELFEFPKKLGSYQNEKIEINNGKYGPYIKYNNSCYALPKNISPIQITLEDAIKLIKNKINEQVSIHVYKTHKVTKGIGKFGSFIKWNNIFINIPKKYDFNNLSIQEIEYLIQKKIQLLKNKKNNNLDVRI